MEIDDLTALLSNLTLSTPAKPVPKPPNALRRIPPEIRVNIFKHALCIWPITNTMVCYLPPPQPAVVAPVAAGPTPSEPVHALRGSVVMSTPNLLAALRSTPDLYGEALEVFYAINVFILDITSFRRFCQLRVEVVKLIRYIVIDIRFDVRFPKETTLEFLRLFAHLHSNISQATGIRRVFLYAVSEDQAIYTLFVNVARHWANLRELSLVDTCLSPSRESSYTQLLTFIREWLRMQDHTKSWVRYIPPLPQGPQLRGLRLCPVSQWMAARDVNINFIYQVQVSEKPT